MINKIHNNNLKSYMYVIFHENHIKQMLPISIDMQNGSRIDAFFARTWVHSFSRVRIAYAFQDSVLLDHWLSFCPFSFGLFIAYPS